MNLEEILTKVIPLVKSVGTFIREERINFRSESIEIKAKNDLVSYVDKESERRLVEGLSAIFPEAGFIAEENTAEPKTIFNWIIDPLDGTTNFVHSIPCYCISVALARENEIILGVVYEIVNQECFYTIKDSVSFLNGKQIQVSSAEKLQDCLIATGFPVNRFDQLPGYYKALDYFIQNTHGVRRIGSAAADLCFVACGRFGGFFEFNLKPWDVAAGALIVKNAGGRVTDFSGGEDWLFGKQILASSYNTGDSFFQIIRHSFSK